MREIDKRGRARRTPSFDGAALPRRAEVKDKRAVRASIRAERDRFFAGSYHTLEPPPEFRALLAPRLVVSSYIPVGSEADPNLLVHAAVTAGCAIALPHIITRDQPMRFLAWRIGDDIHAGPFGLFQPPETAPVVVPDIILTPLLAFDAKLDRLGQGAGYYDRAFAEFPNACRIGVAWAVQQVETLPTDAWDVPLHAIITENGWIPRP